MTLFTNPPLPSRFSAKDVQKSRSKSRKIKLAIISHAYIEPQIYQNIVALNELLDAYVITPRRSNVLIFTAARADKVLSQLRPYLKVGLGGAQYSLLTLSMGFHRWTPDVILIEYDPWSVIFWQTLLARKLFAPDAPLMCHVKKNTYRRYEGVVARVKGWLAQAGLKRVTRILTASQMTATLYQEILGVSNERIITVPHLGVDTTTFVAPARKSFADDCPVIVGYAGRLVAYKGVIDLVHAIAKLNEKRAVPVELVLVGRGELSGLLRELARKYIWLEVLPAIPNAEMPRFYETLDIFVMPARILVDHQEHDALAVVEALSAEVAVIGTNSGILPELLGDGTGIVVDAGCPDQLTYAIGQLANNQGLRVTLGSRGRAKATQDFDLKVVAERKAAIVKMVIDDA